MPEDFFARRPLPRMGIFDPTVPSYGVPMASDPALSPPQATDPLLAAQQQQQRMSIFGGGGQLYPLPPDSTPFKPNAGSSIVSGIQGFLTGGRMKEQAQHERQVEEQKLGMQQKALGLEERRTKTIEQEAAMRGAEQEAKVGEMLAKYAAVTGRPLTPQIASAVRGFYHGTVPIEDPQVREFLSGVNQQLPELFQQYRMALIAGGSDPTEAHKKAGELLAKNLDQQFSTDEFKFKTANLQYENALAISQGTMTPEMASRLLPDVQASVGGIIGHMNGLLAQLSANSRYSQFDLGSILSPSGEMTNEGRSTLANLGLAAKQYKDPWAEKAIKFLQGQAALLDANIPLLQKMWKTVGGSFVPPKGGADTTTTPPPPELPAEPSEGGVPLRSRVGQSPVGQTLGASGIGQLGQGVLNSAPVQPFNLHGLFNPQGLGTTIANTLGATPEATVSQQAEFFNRNISDKGQISEEFAKSTGLTQPQFNARVSALNGNVDAARVQLLYEALLNKNPEAAKLLKESVRQSMFGAQSGAALVR